ncbi:MAG: hypothetical protein ACI9VS_002503 [Candidatus Binatia bacterium]|jgi:hypothetical protein
MKLKTRHFAVMLGTILCLSHSVASVCGAAAASVPQSERFFQTGHVTSSQGPEKAFIRPITRVITSRWGVSQTNALSIVYTPRNGAVWAGPANAHCFFIGAQIVGVYSEPGGNLVFRRSTGRLDATESPRLGMTLERKLRMFLPPFPPRRGLDARPTDVRISLHGILNPGAPVGQDQNRAAEAVTVLGIALDRSQILITSRSGDGRLVELILDRKLMPQFALVDGVTVFDSRAAGNTQ